MLGYWYSPNGSLMVLLSDRDYEHVIVADANSGAERSRLTPPRAGVSVGDFLGWHDDEHLAFSVFTRTRESDPPATLYVEDLAGQPTAAFDLPFNSTVKVYGPPP